MCSLDKLPDLPLGAVLNKLDFVSIQVLRRVCHRFHDFIAEKPPKSKTPPETVTITVNDRSATITFPNENELFVIDFLKRVNGCQVNWYTTPFIRGFGAPPEAVKEQRHFLENEKYLATFFNDFNRFLDYYNRNVKTFRLLFNSENSNFLEKFSAIRPVKIGSYILKTMNQNQWASTLIPIKARSISFDCHEFPRTTDIENGAFLETDAWKNAQIVKILAGSSLIPIEHFINFKVIDIQRSITEGDVVVLKEAFIRNSNPDYFKIRFKNFNPSMEIDNLLGPPLLVRDGYTPYGMKNKIWFYRTQDAGKVLQIQLFMIGMEFKRVDLLSVPSNAVVQD